MVSESANSSEVREAAPRYDHMLWRNNSGACYDKSGRLIRYGLGNDSAQINKMFKSPDLVGIRRVIITPEMVGHAVGVFVGIEMKREGWNLTAGDERGQAQQRFGNIINQWGGDFRFARNIEEAFE